MLYVSPLWCFALQTNSRMFRVFEKVSYRAILTNLSRSVFRCNVGHKRNGTIPSRSDKFHCFDTQDPHSFVQRLTSMEHMRESLYLSFWYHALVLKEVLTKVLPSNHAL